MAHGDRKITSKRGTRNCGWGNTQKHRGAGSRGGRGMAGGYKHKWSYVSKYMPDHFGRYGFKMPLKMIHEDITINVGDIESRIGSFISEGKAQLKDNIYHIDLSAMGFDKLLASGKVTKAYEIKVEKSSAPAVEKIKKAGGNVVLTGEAVAEAVVQAPKKAK